MEMKEEKDENQNCHWKERRKSDTSDMDDTPSTSSRRSGQVTATETIEDKKESHS